MARSIVLCFDGTNNEYAAANTNVVKLYPTGELIEKPCYKFADQKKAPSALGARRG